MYPRLILKHLIYLIILTEFRRPFSCLIPCHLYFVCVPLRCLTPDLPKFKLHMYNEQYYKLIHRRPKLKMLGVIFFFHFYANVQRSVRYGIYCYITKNLTTRKRDSRLQHKCSLIKRSLVRFADQPVPKALLIF